MENGTVCEVLTFSHEHLPESEQERFSSNEGSTEAAVQRAATSPRADHRAGAHLPVEALDAKALLENPFEGKDGGAETHFGACPLGGAGREGIQTPPRNRPHGSWKLRLHGCAVAPNESEMRNRFRAVLSKLFSESHPGEHRKRLVREKAPADLVAWKARLLEDDHARPRAREGARGGGAREAAADHRDVVGVPQGRFQTSSQTKREAIVTLAPGRTGAAIAAISSGV